VRCPLALARAPRSTERDCAEAGRGGRAHVGPLLDEPVDDLVLAVRRRVHQHRLARLVDDLRQDGGSDMTAITAAAVQILRAESGSAGVAAEQLPPRATPAAGI
jgi:hypothetical protein